MNKQRELWKAMQKEMEMDGGLEKKIINKDEKEIR